MTDPFFPAVIETVDVALRPYFLSPGDYLQLTISDEVHEAFSCIKFSKAPAPNRIRKRALKLLPR